MNIIQCILCRKPFQSIGGKVCESCNEKLDEDFRVVRDYIYEHKRADIDKVAEETKVPKQHILYLLKQGRLIIEDPAGGSLLSCEVCKKPISTGKMCDECKKQLAVTMDKGMPAKEPVQKPKDEREQNLKAAAKLKTR